MGPPRVYLSSSRNDLIPYRNAVRDTLAAMNVVCVCMESGTADEHPPLETCLSAIRGCDVYVGLFAYRYGFVPPGQTQSITKLEYEEAGKNGIDRLIFIAEGHWNTALMDSETGEGTEGKLIRQLRTELALAHTVAHFTSPEELARHVALSIHEWMQKQPPPPPLPPPADPRLRAYLHDCIARETERALDELYVRLAGAVGGVPPVEKLLPRPVRVRSQSERGKVQTEELANIVDAVDKYRRVVLVGDPGSGKSTTLHYLHVERAKQALTSGTPVPLFVNLAEWPANIPDFRTLLVQERDVRGCPHLPASQIILLLDGLNELGEQHYTARLEAIQKWVDENPTAQIVLTSREQQYLQGKQLALPIVTIRPFTEAQIEEFAVRHLGDDAPGLLVSIGWESRDRGGGRHLARLAENPFQLLLMCVVYRDQRSLPSTRGELLRILARQLYERERDKGRHCDLGYDEMLAGLGQLALRAVQERAATAIEEAGAARRIANYEPLRTLGVNMNLLRRTKSDRYIHFAHQLVLEYFAAERLVTEPHRLEKILRKPKFARGGGRRAQRSDEVCVTFVQLSTDPAEALLAISRIDPFIAIDTLTQSERMSAVDATARVQLTRDLLRIHEADGDTIIARLRHLGDAAIVPLSELLTHIGNKPARRFAVRAIAAIESLASIEELFAVIRDKDRWVRRDAGAEIRRLAERYPDLAVRFLTERLSRYGPDDRDELVRLLSPWKDLQLREMTVDETIDTVLQVETEVVDRLTQQVEPVPRPAREMTVGEIIDIVLRVGTEVVDRCAQQVHPVARPEHERAEFRVHLNTDEEKEAERAWRVTRNSDDPTKTFLFATFWRSTNPTIRAFGVLGLFNCGEAGRRFALQCFDSCPTGLRILIVRGLTLGGGPVDLSTLVRLLNDPKNQVRHLAMKELLYFDPIRGLEELRTSLRNRESMPRPFALYYLSSFLAEISGRPGFIHRQRLLVEHKLRLVQDLIERERLDLGKELAALLRTAAPKSDVHEKAAISLFFLFEDRIDLLYGALDTTPPGDETAAPASQETTGT
jgi:HEAT repeat protein